MYLLKDSKFLPNGWEPLCFCQKSSILESRTSYGWALRNILGADSGPTGWLLGEGKVLSVLELGAFAQRDLWD